MDVLAVLPNQPPVVSAEIVYGACISDTGDDVVQLDGSASTDPENSALTYEWKFVTVPFADDDEPTAGGETDRRRGPFDRSLLFSGA